LPIQSDTDQDGISDGDEFLTTNTDPLNADSDGDGVNDGLEILFSTNPNDPTDTPILDTDGDGVADAIDNCPTLPNPGQLNSDSDDNGDICDDDDDNDGIPDGLDNSPQILARKILIMMESVMHQTTVPLIQTQGSLITTTTASEMFVTPMMTTTD